MTNPFALAVKDATGATQNIPFPNSNGQAPMAQSAPVVIAGDQIVPVSVAALPLPAGAAADGGDGNGITPPIGGTGIRGWLSGIYSKLSSPLSVTGTVLGPLPAAPVTGQQVVATTAAALPARSLQNGLIVTALPVNTGTVYVGGGGVTFASGYPLSAGQSISFAVANASGISIIGTNATDKIAFAGN